ncbi:unnamed protein product [Boreogadus saida]
MKEGPFAWMFVLGIDALICVIQSSCGSWLRPVDGYGDECCAQVDSHFVTGKQRAQGLLDHGIGEENRYIIPRFRAC